MPNTPAYLITARDAVIARFHTEAGRREWNRLLECSDFDHRATWRIFAVRACPNLPATYLEYVIDAARSALLAERPQTMKRTRRAA
ncbi:MAG: hypothetical protein ACLQMF_20090 [Rectinemataceae bacterium]